MKITEIQCAKCGKYFKAYKSSKRKYCSHVCANKVSISNISLNAERTELICKGCGKEFSILTATIKTREKSSGGKVQYCSLACYRKSRNKQIKVCLFCGDSFNAQRSRQKYCSVKCRDFSRIGKFKTGFWYENGYKVLYAGNGNGIKEHVKIMEDHIGRKIKKGEVVHHKNQIKDDNRLENLEIMSQKDHSRFHRKDEKSKNKILFGGMGGHHGKTKHK